MQRKRFYLLIGMALGKSPLLTSNLISSINLYIELSVVNALQDLQSAGYTLVMVSNQGWSWYR